MTPNEIKEFRNYMRKCISMNFTLEEKKMYNQEEKGDKRSRRSYKKKQWREKPNTRILI